MNDLLPSYASVFGFFLNYLIHSTAATLAMFAILRVRQWAPDVRELLFKTTMIAPVLTSVAVSFCYVPHWGERWPIVWNRHSTNGDAVNRADRVNDRPQTTMAKSSTTANIKMLGDGQRREWPDSRRTNSAMSLPPYKTFPEGLPSPSSSRWLTPDVLRTTLLLSWFAGSLVLLSRIGIGIMALQWFRERAEPIGSRTLLHSIANLARRGGIRSRIELLSDTTNGPLAGGVLFPFIVLPRRLLDRLSDSHQNAILAHEIAHIARRDPLWNLVTRVIGALFFIQPLHPFLRRSLRLEAEYLADRVAAKMLGDHASLANCLTDYGDWLLTRSGTPRLPSMLAVGMGTYRSQLGRRVEMLLSADVDQKRTSNALRAAAGLFIAASLLLTVNFAPRAVADPASNSPDPSMVQSRNENMNHTLTTLALTTALTVPQAVESQDLTQNDEPKTQVATKPEEPSAVGPELRGISGMLLGRLVTKDIERGEFTIAVDYVPRVWRNSKAKNPRSAIGKTLVVDGVAGKWLDALLLIKPGETMQVEVNHQRGDKLRFPGELLEKAAPFVREKHPIPPDDFRGFQGVVTGKIEQRFENHRELTLKITSVDRESKKSTAHNSNAVVGRRITVAGFWSGKLRQPFDNMEVGDTIRCGLVHRVRQSDHFSVTEIADDADSGDSTSSELDESTISSDLNGFQGQLLGRLVSKDIERGEFKVTIDNVNRVWRGSKAKHPKRAVGKTFVVGEVAGKWLDSLLLIKPGETILFEAQHQKRDRLRFPGELLERAAPYDPKRYPSPPDTFRGFHGVVTATIDQKMENHLELTMKIAKLEQSFDGSRAESAESAIGKSVAVAGFWRKQFRNKFESIQPGDTVRIGLIHDTPLSDHFMVAEILDVVQGDSKAHRSVENGDK